MPDANLLLISPLLLHQTFCYHPRSPSGLYKECMAALDKDQNLT